MLKKFVPLNAPASPTQNPHEVRTYIGDPSQPSEWNVEFCDRTRCCAGPPNSTIAKVMTIEDEIRRLHQRAKQSVYLRPPGRRRCIPDRTFTWCVIPQRTPKALQQQASAREHTVMTLEDLATRVHDASATTKRTFSVVKLNSPLDVNASTEEAEEEEADEEEDDEGKRWKPIKPQLASPACSLQAIYVPPQDVLEVKRPKSGMFHNETDAPILDDDDIPYSSYNPRVLQQQFDEQGLRCANIIEGRSPSDLWTWNVGLQKRESDLDQALLEAAIPRLDCDNLELTVYQIPNDLQKTFMVQFVYGNSALPPEVVNKRKPRFYNRPPEISCIYAAFVESFNLNPDFWLAETLDSVAVTGAKLLKKSNEVNYKSEDCDFDILPQLTDKHALLGLKLHYTGTMLDEPNIYKTLSLYFHRYNAAVICTQDLYLLVWKRCRNAYFVYDPNGRDDSGQRDHENGKSTLIILRFIENLVYLILNFSNLDISGEFNLYEINLKNYGKIIHPLPMKPAPKQTHKLWATVNSYYAIIPAVNSGLQQPNTGKEHNPSMIISLLSLLYSDIERACQWRAEVLDELIKFGRAYFKSISKHSKMKKGQHFNIVDLPEQLMMGAYRASLEKSPFLITGTVADCQNYLDSQLVMGLKQLFTGTWESALIQIDNLVLAVFRDVQFFYVFDSFRRGRAGQVLDPEDYTTKGVACLQMHSNFDSLCRIIHQKAILMRRGGRFFIHGIKVGCIKPVYALGGVNNRFPKLKLSLLPCRDETAGEDGETTEPPAEPVKGKKGKGKDKGKDKGKKKKKPERKYSIETIPDDQRIEEFDDEDVVNDVLEEIICEVLHSLMEPCPARSRQYQRAAKVLLQTDKPYLEVLRHQLKHGEDYDNFYAEHQLHPGTPPQPMTLEEELLVPSNYEPLPDGAWVIFGTTHMEPIDDESSKLSGMLATLAASAVSTKYRISTWNSQLVEFALEAANSFGDHYQEYENALKAVLEKNLPRIAIGKNIYQPLVKKIINSTTAVGATKSLRQVLLATLISHNRMVVICQRFSCLIVKRYNFLYMFVGFPCSPVGYRKFGSGPGCILRFVELDGLIRRIEFGCNPQGCEVTNFAVVALKVADVTSDPPKRFLRYTRYEQEALLRSEQDYEKKVRDHKMAKMKFLDAELRKEDKRINEFLREKEDHLAGGRGRRSVSQQSRRRVEFDSEGVEEEEINENMEEGEGEEEEPAVELKHKPGRRLPKYQPPRFRPRTVLYGYAMREKDCVFKIQGSLALDGRQESYLEQIKPCFFASMLAVLYAILRPLNQWNSQRVDRVIEGARTIASRVANMTTTKERIVRNITIDDYQFDVITRVFKPPGVHYQTADNKIKKTVETRNYLLLQLSNCTFAIYHDEYYHLFDPYSAMALAHENDDAMDDADADGGAKPKTCPRGTKRYGERDTASWMLFADVESMIHYIDKRATNPVWNPKGEFEIHIIDIIGYKRAPAPARVLQLMTDLAVPPSCDVVGQYGEEEEGELCAQNESICWLDLEHCLPVWSRMHRRNTAGRYRNLPVTKMKKYDIEIDGRLWSVWGSLHPQAPVFPSESRGRQYLACNVVACCAASIYPLTEWSPQLLDTIVISGDRYHRESMASIRQKDYEFSLEDLNLELQLENIGFVLHMEHVAYGKLYCMTTRTRMNLAEALMYFFAHFRMGVLQCQRRSLAFGRTPGHDGGYFMFDCQSREHPLFPKGQGAAYVLRTKQLQVLLYCIVVTLNIPYHNIGFTLHKVDLLREGTSLEDEDEEEEGATAAD